MNEVSGTRVVSASFKGSLGIRIGRRKKDEEHLEIKRLAGVISLWYGSDLIVTQMFHSRAERKVIIEKWYELYQLRNKHGVFFQLRYS